MQLTTRLLHSTGGSEDEPPPKCTSSNSNQKNMMSVPSKAVVPGRGLATLRSLINQDIQTRKEHCQQPQNRSTGGVRILKESRAKCTSVA